MGGRHGDARRDDVVRRHDIRLRRVPSAGQGVGRLGDVQGRRHGRRPGRHLLCEPRGARANLAAENPAGTAFDDVRADSWQSWDEQLGRVRVSGGTEERRTTFYTALYHALLHPNVFSDVDGRYRGFGDTVADQKIQHVRKGQEVQYSTFSGWDVYRGQLQLLSWLEPAIGSDIATSLFNQAEQNGGVWDRWTHLSGATHVMVGDPSPIALAGMHAFGATDFPLEEALDSVVRAATVPTALDDTSLGWNVATVGQRPSLADYLRLGYYPSGCYAWGCPNETLEISVSEAGIAQLAAAAGRHGLFEQFSSKAQSWLNQFNHAATPDGGWFQDRAADGSWVPGFDPASTAGFVEGTGAIYLWHVQHNPAGLISTLGGDEAAIARLDAHLKDQAGGWSLIGDRGDNLDANMDNAPSIHVPYMYSYAGVPWKTAETVRAILDTIWSTQPAGIPGNDDLGTMSAWYVFSAMGGYPVDPTRSELVVSPPVFPRIEITPHGGRPVTVVAKGADADGRYITGVRVNGENWTRSSLPAGLIADGGTVELDLAAKPEPRFGAAQQDRPTSQRLGEVGYRTTLSTPRITVARGQRSDPVDLVATRLSGQARLRIASAGAPHELRVLLSDPHHRRAARTAVRRDVRHGGGHPRCGSRHVRRADQNRRRGRARRAARRHADARANRGCSLSRPRATGRVQLPCRPPILRVRQLSISAVANISEHSFAAGQQRYLLTASLADSS